MGIWGYVKELNGGNDTDGTANAICKALKYDSKCIYLGGTIMEGENNNSKTC